MGLIGVFLHLQTVKINWKDPSKALTKLHPRDLGEEDTPIESGSFFNFFEHTADPFDVSVPTVRHGNQV
jgi:template-activating factor I